MGLLLDILTTKARSSSRNQNRNLLNDILYGSFVGNTPIVFYNFLLEDYITKGYVGNSEVYSIINKIIEKATLATPIIYVDKGNVKSRLSTGGSVLKMASKEIRRERYLKKSELEYIDEGSDLARLIRQPNPYQSWDELMTLARIFYEVQGEMFLYRNADFAGCATELYVMPAHLVEHVLGGDINNPIKAWKIRLLNGKPRVIAAEDVMHFKKPNPQFDLGGTQLRGMSPLTAGLKFLQLDDKALEAWIKSVENEGAKGVISPSNPDPQFWLQPGQVDKVMDQVDEKMHGLQNKNKIVVSGMPLQYTNIGLSPDALNVIEGLKHAKIQLCDLWSVPPALFDPNPTYSNQKEARTRLVLDVIVPLLSSEEKSINNWLIEPFKKRDGRNYVFDYDLSEFEELKLDIDRAEAMLKIYTFNEVRVMCGADELDTPMANELFIQSGLIPISDYDVDLDFEV